jgi:hypothetical protein
VIRFSASLVVVACGLLVAGGVTSKLLLVYLAIAASAIALVFLVVGAILNRGELRAPSSAEAPGGRLSEASAGSLDQTPVDEREDGAPGRLDRAAAGVRGEPAAGRRDDAAAAWPGAALTGRRDEAPAAWPGAAPGAAVAGRPDATIVDQPGWPDVPRRAPAKDAEGPGETVSPGETDRPKDDDTRSPDQPVTVVPGVPRYHRSDCILIRFMGESDLQKMPVEAAKETGCTPCRACHPDGEETA